MMDVRRVADGSRIRKRKADCQDELHNERLSKRLSLLNLGMYSRIDCLDVTATTTFDRPLHAILKFCYTDVAPERHGQSTTNVLPSYAFPSPEPIPAEEQVTGTVKPPRRRPSISRSDDTMYVDDTAHRIYVHNLDDELSDDESSSDESKFTFHPDIKRRLLATRIPERIRADANGHLAGVNVSNELVLYDIPQSLTVSEDSDNVRKAIIESRARAREAQRRERETFRTAPVNLLTMTNKPRLPEEQPQPIVSPNASLTGSVDEDAMDID